MKSWVFFQKNDPIILRNYEKDTNTLEIKGKHKNIVLVIAAINFHSSFFEFFGVASSWENIKICKTKIIYWVSTPKVMALIIFFLNFLVQPLHVKAPKSIIFFTNIATFGVGIKILFYFILYFGASKWRDDIENFLKKIWTMVSADLFKIFSFYLKNTRKNINISKNTYIWNNDSIKKYYLFKCNH